MKAYRIYNDTRKGVPKNDQSENLRRLSIGKRIFAWYAVRVFGDGLYDLNRRAHNLFDKNPNALVLDIGTGDTSLFRYFYKKIGSKKLYALDLLENENKEVKTSIGDIEKPFPFPDNMFDVVISSQNIEHVIDTPQYIGEISRVLKPGGYAMVLTENFSSWVNIISLVFGWIPFSLTNMFGRPYGNPFIWHSEIYSDEGYADVYNKRIWGCLGHQRLYTHYGLSELFARYDLDVKEKFSGGYFVFISILARILAKIDKRHGHFLGVKAYKRK